MEGVIEGRIVHYVLPDGTEKHRAAIIVNAWTNGGGENGCVNLTVFTDWTNDSKDGSAVSWATSVHYSKTKEPGTWHWPHE